MRSPFDLAARVGGQRLLFAASLIGASLCATTASAASGPRDGLYLMVRYVYGGNLEFDAYYFKAGQVARAPTANIATLDFVALRNKTPAAVGTVSINGDKMMIRWGNGTSAESTLETKAGDPCFAWDAGSFCPVSPFKPGERLDGTFEGGLRSTGSTGTVASNARTISFTSGGTYQMDAVGVLGDKDGVDAFEGGSEKGTYTLNGTDLTLTSGKTYHVLAFPYNADDGAAVKPDHVYFGGSMLKRIK